MKGTRWQIKPTTLNQKRSATYCGVSYSTFRRWRTLADFPPPCVIGILKLWRVRDLDGFLEAHLQISEVA